MILRLITRDRTTTLDSHLHMSRLVFLFGFMGLLPGFLYGLSICIFIACFYMEDCFSIILTLYLYCF